MVQSPLPFPCCYSCSSSIVSQAVPCAGLVSTAALWDKHSNRDWCVADLERNTRGAQKSLRQQITKIFHKVANRKYNTSHLSVPGLCILFCPPPHSCQEAREVLLSVCGWAGCCMVRGSAVRMNLPNEYAHFSTTSFPVHSFCIIRIV